MAEEELEFEPIDDYWEMNISYWTDGFRPTLRLRSGHEDEEHIELSDAVTNYSHPRCRYRPTVIIDDASTCERIISVTSSEPYFLEFKNQRIREFRISGKKYGSYLFDNCTIRTFTQTHKDLFFDFTGDNNLVDTYITEKNVTSISLFGDSPIRNLIIRSPRMIYPHGAHSNSEPFFHDNKTIERVIIEKGLKFIPDGSFSNCPNLRYVRLSHQLQGIGKNAFQNCHPNLTLFYQQEIKHDLGDIL